MFLSRAWGLWLWHLRRREGESGGDGSLARTKHRAHDVGTPKEGEDMSGGDGSPYIAWGLTVLAPWKKARTGVVGRDETGHGLSV